jgi:hypothetical protein
MPSRARECEKGAEIARIGRLQCVDIASAKVTGSHQIRATPGKNGPALPLSKYVRYQTGMAAIAVRKRMDENQAVMKPD